ncbi:glycosyltransferase [Parafannyhessea umbonata]|uniref:Glycosyl transferase family 2 n=1 Tax=Parafannyhessea umbonata TaxID=604330 RepID=A0A1H9NIB4_9ACTN|nr:glycosyltransferase [Parafannyhessea umbonata]SER35405.1 Glycosyl transferase family 2 [Parafannyhessea umbonata]
MGEGEIVLHTASVAMAAYNGERFIAQQIDSVLDQLGSDDELVVSCDPSSDGTFEILEGYAARDSRVRVLANDNHGIVGNFNNAIAACVKDVVFICDQDDVWVPGKRDAVIARLNETGADLLIHNVVHIDAEGKVISKPLFEEYGIRPGLLRNFAAPRYSGCCMAFPQASKRLIMPMPEDVINYDHWVGMVCEALGSVTFMDDVYLRHRLHGDNVTTSRRALGVIARQRFNLLKALAMRRRELRG